jgi:hypothetical protein
MNSELNGEYWSKRYAENDAVWDMGKVSPPLKGYIDQLQNKDLRILIPGCGNAYEAEYLIMQGFTNVTVIDISELLVGELKKKFSSGNPRIIFGDFFELNEQFDLIIEQTFFCALDPALRAKYADKMHELLSDEGKLAGLFFDKDFDGGPPFGGSKEEYENLFSGKFEIVKMETCYNSIPKREGAELIFIMKKNKYLTVPV